MRIGVLTSSRADYGIYLPLLKALQKDPFFDLGLIAFGTHLSVLHGHTIDQIYKDGFRIDHTVEHVSASDTAEAIADSMVKANSGFVPIWSKDHSRYDLVFCLGDRYEMFSAVSIAAPFGIRFAHLHGGETTLGAIDNEFRHCLTVFSSLHFVATEAYAQRVAAIKGSEDHIYCVGSLSLESMKDLDWLSNDAFKARFNIDLSKPSLLVTFHPETVGANNRQNATELVKALEQLSSIQVIITMPNADTMGNTMRQVYIDFAKAHPHIILVENFGTQGYFSCMKAASLVIGNSSSGIIEAASVGKYVINIGDRQKGRARSENVIDCSAESSSILTAINEALAKGPYEGENIYFQKNVVENIIQVLKTWEP